MELTPQQSSNTHVAKKLVTSQGSENNKLVKFTPENVPYDSRPCECSRNLMGLDTKQMSQQNLSVDLFDISAEINFPENDLDPQ